ncbi:MAG TPA: translation initiation factor IF-2 [Thermoanaerobaculia bacterium]|jgi:translation initiation factor IF-2|nr:translation initiation factor IF-2 [Thermoanaerobaculia bacterium]
MGKLRVQDLAKMMGISNQDLVFKLKSIGVRVEGDDAHIDTDIIQAILQGKKLPHPREVILRDEQTPPEVARRRTPTAPPTVARRPAANPLRPQRPRTLIQKVEPRIQTMPVSERPAPVTAPPPVMAEAMPQPAEPPRREAVAGTGAALPVEAPPARTAEIPVRREAPTPPSRPAPPSLRPAPAAGRPAPAPADRRPGPTRPVPPAAAPTGLATEEQKRRAAERLQEQIERDKKKKGKGAKKTGVREEDLTGFKGTLEDLEGEEEAAAGPVSGRRRRRAQRKEDEEKEGGKILSFKKEKPQGPVMISEGMTLREFAEKLGVRVRDLINALFKRGIMANINQVLDSELAQELARDLGVEAMVVSFEEEVQLRQEQSVGTDQPEAKTGRAPVVTIMGHVDHGKTSLLDAIRSSKLTEAEFGGITQHIGAYHVEVKDRQIVFVDTPGHEAFTMMRARGARITDIVVLVVAADDGVMPQTIEAIDHARAAKVPLVVAINKIDKPNANLDRVKKELADRGLVPEDWGGDTVMVPISALKRQGISDLLEMILLTADILELKANPDIAAQGAVLEARKEVGRGIVATVLVQNGTLRVGDVFVSGATWGRVRSMSDDVGRRAQAAGPSTPAEVTGFNDLPDAGDLLQVVEDESKARGIAEFRAQEQRRRGLAPTQARMSLDQLFNRIQEGEVKELPVILKADVQGSVEVLREALGKASTDKVKVVVLHTGVGAISTNDVLLASASKAVVIGFNVRPERSAVELAEKEGVEIRLHTVIYELIDELRNAMTGLLEPTFREVASGRAEVRDTFKVPKAGTIAGCHVVEGVIPRSASVRLLRDNRVIYEGKIASLRRFKDDVSEVRTGFDCGIGLERFQDVKPGDVIEAFTREEVAPVL